MFAINDKGTIRPLTEQKIIGPQGQAASRQILTCWTADELKAWNIYAVTEDPIPDGHRLLTEDLQKTGDVVRLVRTTELVPPPTQDQRFDVMDKMMLEIFFRINNRLRVVEGQAAITPLQFKTYIKSLMT